MPFPLAGIIGGMASIRAGHAFASTVGSKFLKGPLIQGGQFGVGYTAGSYGGYGISNTVDPLRIHQSYKRPQRQNTRKLSYGYSYGRRRYRRRYGYSRYSRYRSRYGRRRSYYRRGYY